MADKFMRVGVLGKDGTAKSLRGNNEGVVATYQPSTVLKPGDTALPITAFGYTSYQVNGDFESLAISISADKACEISVGMLAIKNETTVFGNLPYETKQLTSLGGNFGAYWELPMIDRVNDNRVYIRNESPFAITVKYSLTAKHTLPSPDKSITIKGSKTETIEDSSATKILNGSEGRFVPTGFTAQHVEIPHFNKGIFEQTILMKNDTDADFTVRVIPLMGNSSSVYGAVIYEGVIKKSAGRIVFSSEVTPSVLNDDERKIVGLIELRLPYSKFRIEYTPLTSVTTGEITYKMLRRY